MPTAACYVRVSTDHQRENYSISEQTSPLQAFCQAKDITIGKIYTDGGYSGGNLNRPALREMLSHLKEYDVVIVYKLDRLSRSQKDTLLLIEDYFLASKVDFISVCENFDTSTPLGRAMIGMLSVFAQLEKDQITERFTMGRIARAKNGYYHGGSTAPTGYDYVDGRLVINEEEARQVQELYERFRQGHSIHDCWQYMKSRYHTKYGGWNSETLVRNVLRNEVYIGKVKFNQQSYPGNHRPIIREELFREVQKLLQDRSQKDFSSGSSSRKAPSLPEPCSQVSFTAAAAVPGFTASTAIIPATAAPKVPENISKIRPAGTANGKSPNWIFSSSTRSAACSWSLCRAISRRTLLLQTPGKPLILLPASCSFIC